VSADPQVRPLTVADLDGAVNLVQSSFSATLLPYMTYGQRGIRRFLEGSLLREGVMPAREALVAVSADHQQVVGYAEFDVRRKLEPHLAYICVAQAQRGRGLASRLIHRFAETNRDAREMTLDVFTDNEPARRLYERLGFRVVGHSEWNVRPLPAASQALLEVEDLPQSLAVHEAFGFSMLNVVHEGRRVPLGRLGGTRIRVLSEEAFADDAFLAAVRNAFPAAESALLVSAKDMRDTARSGSWARLAQGVRMQGPLNGSWR
jgi:ribosomal protein S18 acetylase RimI-like enzyme